jgi:ribosomal protein S18 acetylase RimI-like enzyme
MLRHATDADLLALAELERDANLAGLAHVFAPERHPFPFDSVLARWRLVLDDPATVVLVLDAGHRPGPRAGLDLYLAHDHETIRHLAVHPARWGRGLAATAMAAAVADMARRGTRDASLWVLEENERARRLYERLGWAATAERRDAPWPPYPTEMRYTRPLG